MYFGVDYYPEHWDVNIMNNDIKRIKEMGANIVRIGEFAWHLMEKEEGQYDFSFFDLVIEKCKNAEIKIMFGTPTATFPAWLAKKHPSILSKDENLQERSFGGRRQYCYNSPIYLEYSNKIVNKLVDHYKNEETIISWQVDNEFGHEGSDDCYCETCQNKFQEFLEKKYVNIDVLNETYGTIFWGQSYNNFKEIPSPLKTITTHNPSLKLDWMRFKSHSLNSYANSQISLVKSLRGSHQEVTTNFSGGYFIKLYDHEENAKNLDFVSYDNYPVWGGLKEPMKEAQIAMTLDFIRGLQEKNFWIVEQLMGAQGHDVIGYLPRPNQAKMWAYQAFAHGCENMLWFRWRGMNRGAEQYCYGIIDHDNRAGRKYLEVKETIEDLSKHETLIKTPIKSDIAVIYDFDNIWSWRAQKQSVEFDFTNEFMRLYTPFYNNNLNIDVIPFTKDFMKYKIIVLPVTKIIDEPFAERLKTFVSGGGTLIFSFRTGIKDRNNNIPFGKTLPGLVKDLCGIEVEEVESLQKGQETKINGYGKYKNLSGLCSVWRDLIIPQEAEVLFEFGDKFYEGKACITKNSYKHGKVYYFGGGINEDVLNIVVKDILDETGIKGIDTPKGLEVYKRNLNGENRYFILNHTDENIEYQGIIYKAFECKIVEIL